MPLNPISLGAGVVTHLIPAAELDSVNPDLISAFEFFEDHVD